MKICFTMKFVNNPLGGGNQFLSNFVEYIKKNDSDIDIVYDLGHDDIDIIFILDPRVTSVNKIHINKVIAYKKNHKNVKIIHRVNECDIKREKSIGIDKLLVRAMKIADIVVFLSDWLRNYFVNKYNLNVNSVVIHNGCNRSHFFIPTEQKHNDKIKIVTHHWSSNYLKGFEIYNKIDQYLENNNSFEFVFVGNYIKNYKPKNIRLIKPKRGVELGNVLRECDLYLTASQFEPGGMHNLEGVSCGLPILYRKNSGGIGEVCKDYGEEFDDMEDMLEKIESVYGNRSEYISRIDYEYLGENRCCEEYYKVVKSIM